MKIIRLHKKLDCYSLARYTSIACLADGINSRRNFHYKPHPLIDETSRNLHLKHNFISLVQYQNVDHIK